MIASYSEEPFAAIDLGSNSFHLVVARLVGEEYRVLDKYSEKVSLAAGLDHERHLDEPSKQRALECLQRISQRLNGIPKHSIRIVGTNTLRVARDKDEFLDQIEEKIGASVEVLAGREEARLIFLGASHSLPNCDSNRLVIDIGGGSTELIIGSGFEPIVLESMHMGCVSYSEHFFPDGTISKDAFNNAVKHAERELLPLERPFTKLGWEEAVGCSGTIKSAFIINEQLGNDSGLLTLADLKRQKKEILRFGKLEDVNLPGLSAERQAIFPAGLAILIALFKRLDIENMTESSGALREGVLYDMLGRHEHEDVRQRTTRQLMRQYQVDIEQADKVTRASIHLFNLVEQDWDLKSEHRDLLARASLLHELGLAVAHNQFHKHGAYILTHADLPGFGKQEQRALAFLVRSHRRKYPTYELATLDSHYYKPTQMLSVLLRLAVIFERGVKSEIPRDVELRGDYQDLELFLPRKWLKKHPLTYADLEQEVDYLSKAKINLVLKEK